MFIHIGDNISILKKDVILILDKKTLIKSKTSRLFIQNLIQSGSLINHNDEDSVKTYIVARDKSKRNRRRAKDDFKLYTSNISSRSLFNREKTNV